jgi:hypothetical protein
LSAAIRRDKRPHARDDVIVVRTQGGGVTQSDDLLGLVATGQHNTDILADGHALGTLAQAVLQRARVEGADVLVAASPSAERLVGAALMLAPDSLRGLRSGEWVSGDDVVLVIDVNLASGTSMATMARRVRRLGAQHVVGAVMHFLSDKAPSARDCGLDMLSIFGASPEHASQQ